MTLVCQNGPIAAVFTFIRVLFERLPTRRVVPFQLPPDVVPDYLLPAMNPAAVASHSSGSPDDAATALRGASLAFQRSPAVGATSLPTSPPPLQHHTRDGAGALTAASSSSSAGRSRSPYRVVANATGNNGGSSHAHDVDSPVYQAGMVAARLHQLNGSPAQLQPASAQRIDPKSPSFIAATLAASRSVSPSPLVRTPRRKISFGAVNALANMEAVAVDSESIAPTGNLISMFERAKDVESSRKQSPSRGLLSPAEAKENIHGAKTVPKKGVAMTSPKPKKYDGLPAPPEGVNERRSSSMPPKQLPTHVVRRSEKISAMPMPKPKLPLELSASPKPPNKPFKPQPPPPTETKPEPASKLSPDPRFAKPAPRPRKVRTPSPPSVISRSTTEVLSPKPVRLIKPTLAPPVLSSPPQGSPGITGQMTASPSLDPEKRSPNTNLRPPTPPKPRGSQRLSPNQSASRNRHHRNSDTPLTHGSPSSTPLTEFGLPIVTPSPPQPRPLPQPRRQERRNNTPPPLPIRRESVASAPTSPVHDNPPRRRRPTNTSTNNLGLDPLTSAMMASSLAASRLTPHNTGSSLPPPSLPKRQKSPRLLQTLRLPQSHFDEDPERLKIAHRHKLSSNKHAHHEGSRKRWRDQITQRERKRYEAVWASNRGYLLHDDSPSHSLESGLNRIASECVANIVVREIWKRSRLPEDELVEVWELVDRGSVGILTRQEFIVGMWLIDQRLRGRKLPTRVSDSVWGSANGVRISKLKR